MDDERHVEAFYQRGQEAHRLDAGEGLLEFLRTQDILARHLPKPPRVILDVGGAAGVHAFPLAAKGHAVHLLDPMAVHVEQARERDNGELASIRRGDARALPYPTRCAHAALLFGPLYHLTKKEDRLRALREAHRALRPGGLVFAAAISRFAALHHALGAHLLSDPVYSSMLATLLNTGQYRNPSHHPDWFTTAWFHLPEELKEEVTQAGFTNVRLLAVEGPCGVIHDFSPYDNDPAQQRALLHHLRLVEEEPSLLGASPHVLAIGEKPR